MLFKRELLTTTYDYIFTPFKKLFCIVMPMSILDQTANFFIELDDAFIYYSSKVYLMNKLVFVALALVLSSAVFVGNTFVFQQAEAVGENCPSKKGNTDSQINPTTPQPVSAQISNTQIF